jgi:hypothetical protein
VGISPLGPRHLSSGLPTAGLSRADQ